MMSERKNIHPSRSSSWSRSLLQVCATDTVCTIQTQQLRLCPARKAACVAENDGSSRVPIRETHSVPHHGQHEVVCGQSRGLGRKSLVDMGFVWSGPRMLYLLVAQTSPLNLIRRTGHISYPFTIDWPRPANRRRLQTFTFI
jgi:hypothetical protein